MLKYDELLNFEETTLNKVLDIENIKFVDSDGEEIEQRHWLTVMNFATNEREPEKQFCLIPKELAEKIENKRKTSEAEQKLLTELTATKIRVCELQDQLSEITETNLEFPTDEENAVETSFQEEVSEEVFHRDGERLTLIYTKKRGN